MDKDKDPSDKNPNKSQLGKEKEEKGQDVAACRVDLDNRVQPPPQAALMDDRSQQPSRTSQWIPPSTGNPDLDPIGAGAKPDLRSNNPLTPHGMIMDPKNLFEHQFGQRAEPNSGLPPGARFDPFGPPDPSQVGPGRGPKPGKGPMGFKGPNPDHFPPPGPGGPFI